MFRDRKELTGSLLTQLEDAYAYIDQFNCTRAEFAGLDRIDDCRNPYPQCIMAVGNAPIEDCGGPDGFAHTMEVLNNPKHPVHKEISEWVRST